jgi:hypothetical protein
MRKWWKECKRDSWLRILRILHAAVRCVGTRTRYGSLFRPRETSGVQTPHPCAPRLQVQTSAEISTRLENGASGDCRTKSAGRTSSDVLWLEWLDYGEAKTCMLRKSERANIDRAGKNQYLDTGKIRVPFSQRRHSRRMSRSSLDEK